MTQLFDLMNKTGLGTVFNGLCLTAFILGSLWICYRFLFQEQEPESKIVRTVKGNPRHPKSTRTLSGISKSEIKQILMSLKAVAFVAGKCLRLPDRELETEMNQLVIVSTIEGFGEIDRSIRTASQWRKLLRRQQRLALRLITKFENACCGRVSGIRPAEYALLVEALQAGYREASVFEGMEADKLAAFMEAGAILLKRDRKWRGDLPLPSEGVDAAGYYSERKKWLDVILERVNQPHCKVVYVK